MTTDSAPRERQKGVVGRSEKLKTSWQRSTQPSQALKVPLKSTAALFSHVLTKAGAPVSRALTRPIWARKGKYKPACAQLLISWRVRACFLCISPNKAFHWRVCAPRSHSSSSNSQLQTISSHRVTVSRSAPGQSQMQSDILEDGQCKSPSHFVRFRQCFKPKKWLGFSLKI